MLADCPNKKFMYHADGVRGIARRHRDIADLQHYTQLRTFRDISLLSRDYNDIP